MLWVLLQGQVELTYVLHLLREREREKREGEGGEGGEGRQRGRDGEKERGGMEEGRERVEREKEGGREKTESGEGEESEVYDLSTHWTDDVAQSLKYKDWSDKVTPLEFVE